MDVASEQWTAGVMLAFACVWIFCVGSAVGSFLNVVAYRLPRGLGLVRPGSFCPICRTPILWHDNIPVLGWIRLRGQCRACGVRIPGRYAVVEAVVGLTFLGSALVELGSGGANLPFRVPDYRRVSWTQIWMVKVELSRIFVFHLMVLTLLITWILVRWDRQRLPVRFWLLALAFGLLPLAWFANLQPTPWPTAWQGGAWEGLLKGMAGVVAGGILGTAWFALVQRHARWPGADLAQGGGGVALVGLFLGWQAVFSVLLFATLIALVGSGLLRQALFKHGRNRRGADPFVAAYVSAPPPLATAARGTWETQTPVGSESATEVAPTDAIQASMAAPMAVSRDVSPDSRFWIRDFGLRAAPMAVSLDVSLPLCVGMGTFVHLAMWSRVIECPIWPLATASWNAAAGSALLLLGVTLLHRAQSQVTHARGNGR